MRLYAAPFSPFARKVRIAAAERGLAGTIELCWTDPWTDAALAKLNPLAKIPTLLLADGTALYDSPVIAEYLDGLGEAPPLFPAPGPARWAALRLQAAGDGLCDAALLRRQETLRPEAQRSESWDARQRRAVAATLAMLEEQVASLDGPLTIGGIAIGAALGYLDLRFAGEPWRQAHPALATWFEGFAARPSFARTLPPAA